jgi:hypothetical protein
MFYKNGSPEHLRGPFLRGKNLSKRLLSEIAAVYGVLRKFNTSILSKNEAELEAATSRECILNAAIDRDCVLQGLREVAANKAEPASSRVRSLELLGKELGMFREGIDHTFQWDGDPAKLTEAQRAKMLLYIEQRVAALDAEIAAAGEDEGPVVEVTAEEVGRDG